MILRGRRGRSSGWKVPVQVVLDLHFLAGQDDPSPANVTGTRIIFADDIGVSCQNRNRPIRFMSQTIVGFVNRVGSLHLIIIAWIRRKVSGHSARPRIAAG